MTFQGRKVKYSTRSEDTRAVELMLPNKLLVICAHAHNKCSTVNGRGLDSHINVQKISRNVNVQLVKVPY